MTVAALRKESAKRGLPKYQRNGKTLRKADLIKQLERQDKLDERRWVMAEAAGFRREGLSRSDALHLAWTLVRPVTVIVADDMPLLPPPVKQARPGPRLPITTATENHRAVGGNLALNIAAATG